MKKYIFLVIISIFALISCSNNTTELDMFISSFTEKYHKCYYLENGWYEYSMSSTMFNEVDKERKVSYSYFKGDLEFYNNQSNLYTGYINEFKLEGYIAKFYDYSLEDACQMNSTSVISNGVGLYNSTEKKNNGQTITSEKSYTECFDKIGFSISLGSEYNYLLLSDFYKIKEKYSYINSFKNVLTFSWQQDNITITERYHFDENLILTKIIREEKLIDEINGSRFTMKTLEKTEKENIEIPTDYTTELMFNPLYGINL